MHRWSPFLPPRPFVVPVPIDPRGLTGPTPGAARGRRWERTSSGRYVPTGTDRDRPEQRIAEAFAASPASAAVTGWGALRMHGAAFLDGRIGGRLQPVMVRVPPTLHPRGDGSVNFLRTETGPVFTIMGIHCTSVLTALFDAARLSRNVRDAVVAIDMTAAARLITVREVRHFVGSRSWSGVPGVPQLREALTIASDHSASPPETRLRLVWVLDAGLPPPLVNVPVYDRNGCMLGIPDLLDPVAGLVVEYDGDDHRDPARHSDDVDREARFRAVGLEVTRVTGRDLRRKPELINRLHEARRRARFEPETTRRWVLGR